METINNKLFLGGISVEELTEKYSSPLYVYEEDKIIGQYNKLKNAIIYPKTRIYYAAKANTNIEILKVLNKEGCGIDAVSPEEIYISKKAGFDSSNILFTGNNASEEDFKYCIENDVLVNIGSLEQIELYGKLNPNSKISIRINPDVGAGHHDHCITGGPNSKFGVYFDKIDKIKEVIEKYNLTVVGIHEHIGSGILDTSKFLLAMDVLLKVAKSFDNLEFIDFGGGIGVPYRPGEKQLDIEEFGKAISDKFNDFCSSYGKELYLCLEPGRYIVAEAGFLLAKVVNKKSTPNHVFVGINTGFNHLIRPAMYGSYHHVLNASNMDTREEEKLVVAGNVCESGDVFTQNEDGIEDRMMPKTKVGDVLAICNAGAYGFSMASNYNSRRLPAEVIVSKGEAKIIRERQSLEDLL
ncbi:MAG: diaminopimelate decarboxylase [Candidatus Aenigmarchaeota archaeon]|nr:diaminopimelate decarboxylase [Candidatus Aenigmarchaeota archaeon]